MQRPRRRRFLFPSLSPRRQKPENPRKPYVICHVRSGFARAREVPTETRYLRMHGVLRKHRMNYFASAHDRQNYFARRGFIVATGLSAGGISGSRFYATPVRKLASYARMRGYKSSNVILLGGFEASFLFQPDATRFFARHFRNCHNRSLAIA